MYNGGIITVFKNVDLKTKFLYLSTLRSTRIIYIYIYIYIYIIYIYIYIYIEWNRVVPHISNPSTN